MPATFAGLAWARRAARISATSISILHADLKQALGGGGSAGAGGNRIQVGDIAASGFDQRADNVAHHVFEEAAAAHAVDKALWGALHGGREDGAHLGFALGIADVGGGEGGEIVLAFEDARQLRHTFLIQRVGVVINVRPLERATYFVAKHA